MAAAHVAADLDDLVVVDAKLACQSSAADEDERARETNDGHQRRGLVGRGDDHDAL